MRGLFCMASRDKVDVDTFHKGIQYALEKLGKSKFGFEAQQYQILKAKDTKALGTSLLIIPELCVLVLTKGHVGSGNEIERSNPGSGFIVRMRSTFWTHPKSGTSNPPPQMLRSFWSEQRKKIDL